MRIGIDIRALAEGKTTGVEVYTTSLVRALLRLDNKNSYRLFYNSYRPAAGLPEFSAPNAKLKVFRYPNRILNASFRFLDYPKIDYLLGGLDVFFSPRFLFTSLSRRCRRVVTTHDLSFVDHSEFFSLKQRVWHFLLSDRNASYAADRIIAVSESTRRDLVNLFNVAESKISVVYPGVDNDFYSPDDFAHRDAEVLSRFKLAPLDYILYLGTFEPRKNILGIIDAYEQLRLTTNHRPALVLAGKLGWLYRRTLSRIADSKYREDIKILSAVIDQDKPSLYRNALACLFPSFYEGFGFPPLEAMASGTPVIASMNSSFPEVLGDACLYCNPYNSDSLFRSLAAVMDDESLRKTLAAAGKRKAQEFSWVRAARQTLDVFESAVKNNA